MEYGKFEQVTKELLGNCNSDAYIFVNQPGLSKLDFKMYADSWKSLSRYINGSSSVLKFEKVELPRTETNDLFDRLMEYTTKKCRIEDKIIITGNDTDSFQPYIDAKARIIRIDFPELPDADDQNAEKSRGEAIEDYDMFLRKILAQIPSPDHTIVYTSLKPGLSHPNEDIIPIEIFPEIFNDESRQTEFERNYRIRDEKPFFHTPNPNFKEVNSKYISVFDEEFVQQNKQILQAIVLGIIGFITLQVFFYFRANVPEVANTKLQTEGDKKDLNKKTKASSKTKQSSG